MAIPKITPPEVESPKSMELVQQLAREAAKRQLAMHANHADIVINELKLTDDYNHEHWTVAILVSAKTLNISFRAHFNLDTATKIACLGLKRGEDKITPEIAKDFVSEYCNLTAGMIRRSLQASHVIDGEMTLTVPIHEKLTSVTAKTSEQDIIDCWSISVNGFELICAMNMRIFDWSRLKSLENLPLSAIIVSDEGSISFL